MGVTAARGGRDRPGRAVEDDRPDREEEPRAGGCRVVGYDGMGRAELGQD